MASVKIPPRMVLRQSKELTETNLLPTPLPPWREDVIPLDKVWSIQNHGRRCIKILDGKLKRTPDYDWWKGFCKDAQKISKRVKSKGILSVPPIAVHKGKPFRKFHLLDGFHRLAAFEMAGKKGIPAMIFGRQPGRP